MKIWHAVHVTPVVAILMISSWFCSAQDKPIGDVAREAQAQKSDAHHARKLITDDDIGPDRGPVRETDDPVSVVRDALRGFLADPGHICHGELTNSSGPGSVVKSLIEAQGQDRIHMVVKDQRSSTGDTEVVILGNDKYGRIGALPWQKYSDYVPGEVPFARLAAIAYDSGLKLVRREAIDGFPSFLYENSYQVVSTRNRTDDIWIGAEDHRIRKAQMQFTQSGPTTAPIVTRYTLACSYGPVPEIKPPI